MKRILTNPDQIKALKAGQIKSLELELKAADTVSTANITGDDDLMPQVDIAQIFSVPNDPSIDILSAFPVVQVTSPHIFTATETSSQSGEEDVSTTNEGAEKRLEDFYIDMTHLEWTKFAGSINIDRELLDDIGFVETMIRTRLLRQLTAKIADNHISKIINVGAAITAGSFSTPLQPFNEQNVPAVIYSEMRRNGGNPGYTPTLFALNAPEFGMIHYSSAGSESNFIDLHPEIKIVHNTTITAGNVLAVDPVFFPVFIRQSPVIKLGYQYDDFTKNRVTIIGEARVGFNLDSSQLQKAIFYDTWTNIKTALTPS